MGRRSVVSGWPEGSRLRYYDEEGNRIAKEWRDLGRRKAEMRKRDKAADATR